ncbi:MAG: LytTR family DNA-binding domain-containing protein [Acidobacteriota bacterium]
MKELSVLIVEDEPLAREMIGELLERAEGVRCVGSCANALEAQRKLAESPPDILLLDVEMPGLSGVDLLQGLGDAAPAVVFVTAHEEHALRAFELSAVDYVLKPFPDERFLEAVDRARRRVLERRVSEIAVQLSDAAPEPPAPEPNRYLKRLAIQKTGRKLLVPVEEVRWIESDDYCVRVHAENGSHVLRASLNELEKQLDPEDFLRVHRGAIVRLEAVETIRRREHGTRVLKLRTGEQVNVARSRSKAVEERLVPRIGPKLASR